MFSCHILTSSFKFVYFWSLLFIIIFLCVAHTMEFSLSGLDFWSLDTPPPPPTNVVWITEVLLCVCVNHSLVTRPRAGLYNVQIPASSRGFTILQNLQLDSGAHPVAYSVGTRVPSQEVNTARDVKFTTHLHLVLRLRMRGYTSTPRVPSWCGLGQLQRRQYPYVLHSSLLAPTNMYSSCMC